MPDRKVIVPVADPFVNVIVIYNALDLSDRTVDRLEWRYEKTLAEYLDGLPDNVRWAITVNGEPIDNAQESDRRLLAGDSLTLMPQPAGGGGGGGGKSIVRLVATLALSVIAPYAGAAMGITQATVGALGMKIFTGLFTMVGGLLLNSMLPGSAATAGDDIGTSDSSESSTYGIDGAKNTSTEDVPVPLVFGEFRTGGNIQNIKTVNDGDTQILYMQLGVSEGEVESISDFEIDSQSIGNYQDVETAVRLGTADQEVLDWFDDTITLFDKAIVLNTAWVKHSTLQEIDKFRIDLTFGNGLANINTATGAKQNMSVPVEIEYRKIGTTEWQSATGELEWVEVDGATTLDNATGVEVTVATTGGTSASSSYNHLVEYRKVGEETWQTLAEESGSFGNTPYSVCARWEESDNGGDWGGGGWGDSDDGTGGVDGLDGFA